MKCDVAGVINSIRNNKGGRQKMGRSGTSNGWNRTLKWRLTKQDAMEFRIQAKLEEQS